MVLNRDDIISIQFAIVPLRKLLAKTKRARRKSKKETHRTPNVICGDRVRSAQRIQKNKLNLVRMQRVAAEIVGLASRIVVCFSSAARTLHRNIVCAVRAA